MRLSTSKCPSYIEVRWLDEDFNLHEVVKQQLWVNRSHLTPSVKEEYNHQLEKILLEEGIKHPLIVLRNTYENWNEATIDLKYAYPFNPEPSYLVVYGNQRLQIFDKLEHQHTIPIFLADSHVEAILIFHTLQQMITNI